MPIIQKRRARGSGTSPADKFSCLLEIIQSSERAAREDRMQQQQLMMQMMNQNQQMMMAIASLGNRGGTSLRPVVLQNLANDEKIKNCRHN